MLPSGWVKDKKEEEWYGKRNYFVPVRGQGDAWQRNAPHQYRCMEQEKNMYYSILYGSRGGWDRQLYREDQW